MREPTRLERELSRQLYAARDELKAAQQAPLDLQDRLDDLLTGIRFWRDQKVGSMELTTADEMLLRWVEHNEEASSDA